MRKTILMLINGFGVERSDSAEVYSSKLMPNLDAMTKTYLFGTLSTPAGDYNNGYKLFSISGKGKGYEDEIDMLIFDKHLDRNKILQDVKNSITAENNLHIFYALEDDAKINQMREFLRIINGTKDKRVFVHLILTGTSTANYAAISKVLNKLSFELGAYCKVGIIVGKNKINSDDMLRTFYREFGEHWNEAEKKIDVLRNEIVNPENAGVFMVNKGFALKENDSVLFMNYDDVEMDRFFSDFTKMPVKLFSLYPFKDNIPHMFTKDLEINGSFAGLIEKHQIKILVLTTQDRVNDINFYLNGMEKKKSPNIAYAVNDISLFATKESTIDIFEKNNFDGYIIDYQVGLYNKMDMIKGDLQKIDTVIKSISEASQEKNYTFIISSLYGMHAPVMDGVVQKVVNFSGKVPCIFQSNDFTKKEYSLNSGNIYALTLTFLTNINDEVKSNKLVHKLSGLEKMLSKNK